MKTTMPFLKPGFCLCHVQILRLMLRGLAEEVTRFTLPLHYGMLQGEEFKMAPVTAAGIFTIAAKREAYSSQQLFS